MEITEKKYILKSKLKIQLNFQLYKMNYNGQELVFTFFCSFIKMGPLTIRATNW